MKTPNRMDEVLKLLEAFVVRVYLTRERRSDAGSSRFNQMAHSVHTGLMTHETLISELKSVNNDYQNNDGFRRALTQNDLYNALSSRTIKYLLLEYENYLRENADIRLALATQEQILTSDYEVEHIWPQNPTFDIPEEGQFEYAENKHRLGNLTIASKPWNISMGNKPFTEKKCQPDDNPSYTNSSLLVQRELVEESEWNVGAIEARENRIVNFALERWRVS